VVVVCFHPRGEKNSDDNFEISLQGLKGAWFKKKKKNKSKAKQSPKTSQNQGPIPGWGKRRNAAPSRAKPVAKR